MRIVFITNPDGYETALYAEAAQRAGHRVAGIVVPISPAPLLRRARERFRRSEAGDRRPLLFREGWGGHRRLRGAWDLHALAFRRRVPIIPVWSLGSRLTEALMRILRPDILFTSALSHRVPPALLRLPRLTAANIHGGKLPEYAGLSSAFWLVFDHSGRAALTIHELLPRWDSGRVILRRSVALPPDIRPDALAHRLIQLAAESLPDAIRRCERGKYSSGPPRKAVLRRHPSPEDIRIMGQRLSAPFPRKASGL